MKVLIVTQWYPPEPWQIFAELAETLQEIGHSVEVLTAFPNWPAGKIYRGYHQRWRMRETINDVAVLRVPLYMNHSSSGVRRLANVGSFMLSVSVLGPVNLMKPDIIYAIQPPTTGLAARWLARFWRVPYIYDVQDMWPETLMESGFLRSRLALRLVSRLCNTVYADAAGIRVISEGFKDNLVGKRVQDRKIAVIPNWVDTTFYRPMNSDRSLLNQLGIEDHFSVMYGGSIGPPQDLGVIVEVASLLKNDHRFRFIIVGDGSDLQRLGMLSKSRDLENICFLGRKPRCDMPSLYAAADCLLLHLRDIPVHRITIPSKVYAYMACGKPIIAAVAGDTAKAVTGLGAGFSCLPGKPSEIVRVLTKMADLSVEMRRRLGDAGRHAAETLFSRRHVVEQISRLLQESVVSRKRD